MYIRRIISTIFLFALIVTTVRAQNLGTEKKDFILHFRFDRSLVDSGYRNNNHTLRALQELLSDSLTAAEIDTIDIHAYSSPDGNGVYNHALARRRAKAMKGYLVWKYPHLNQRSIHTGAGVAEWRALLPLIENSPDMPCRKQVMEILASDVSAGVMEIRLRTVGGGAAYRYIRRHILPELRNASVCTVWLKKPRFTTILEGVRKETLTPLCRIGNYRNIFSSSCVKRANDLTVSGREGTTRNVSPAFTGKVPKRPFIALKTNLLFDLAFMPNVELEVPIGERWSVNGELMFPWWLFDGDKYCLQILSGGVEGRYWLGNRSNRRVLTGYFFGLYAGGGKYDLQWDKNGYQGEFFIAAGVSYGYSMRIVRNLNLEFSLGIGLLRTGYEHYHARDSYQTLLWQNNGRYTWIGPTKAKISLVWMLNRKMKGGKK